MKAMSVTVEVLALGPVSHPDLDFGLDCLHFRLPGFFLKRGKVVLWTVCKAAAVGSKLWSWISKNSAKVTVHTALRECSGHDTVSSLLGTVSLLNLSPMFSMELYKCSDVFLGFYFLSTYACCL